MKLNTKSYEEKMQKAIAAYENNLAVIRAGQANTAVLSRVSFEYYGSMTPINTMADIRQQAYRRRMGNETQKLRLQSPKRLRANI